jgi:hypothetical protein
MIVLRGDGTREVDELAVTDRQHVIHSRVLVPDCFLRVPRPEVSAVRHPVVVVDVVVLKSQR